MAFLPDYLKRRMDLRHRVAPHNQGGRNSAQLHPKYEAPRLVAFRAPTNFSARHSTLIPYLGVFLAPIPPLASGIDILSKAGVITIVVAIIGLHMVTINFVYPRIVGRRLRLNPLVVSLSLLFWVDLGSARIDSGDPDSWSCQNYL